ncbi:MULTISPECIES: acyl-CoA thioesterase [Pantoea]|jgi:acyl-CoA thioester hydrolase|uniref:Acyl-CoA thioesterase n=1 Tax=Pantoea trifolii TaxID=2968030 RepID=A0ABT1VQT3_9GAMM|nr:MULTISPECIES: acyl-CoA thioesterase [Pantoea]MDY0927218.1 acyl-CoA thioesterase [Enterobacter sp. CFBP8995]MRT43302.1 acyl-CoA thioesterase [Enterobacteriaceae bacterium RIT702]MCQ8229911.1 acyl-CoA thioesterase [Pantoea sp. MMK2]MCQ8238626.1 acyl-CoA thioesterase [Pantoea sp. MMK3]MCW6030046.1 acyl-CoA thioesterase [Pantoea sp. JK]
MFTKQYEVDEKHIDFQGVVDGLYYPFYMEWTRHAYMREALGIDMEEEFKQGKIYMVLEYSLRFRKSLVKGDQVEVTCVLAKNEKRNRVNFVQQILVNGVVYADATFVATCLQNGRPSMPDAVMNALADA